MANQSQLIGPYDYLASGIEKSLDIISRGRAEDRQRKEKLADVASEQNFRAKQLADEIALRKSIEASIVYEYRSPAFSTLVMRELFNIYLTTVFLKS